jgi:hypothetical protein
MATISNYLERYFEPVTSVLTPELAEKILSLRPDSEIVARVEELGNKADEGTLSDEEREEYEEYVDAGDFIALLKAKARRYLAQHTD